MTKWIALLLVLVTLANVTNMHQTSRLVELQQRVAGLLSREPLPFPKLPSIPLGTATNGTSCSAVPIAPGWLLTARHVGTIEGDARFDCPFTELTLLKAETPVDVVMVRMCPPDALPKLGDRLYALGWQNAQFLEVTEGVQQEEPSQMSCPVSHGCSGGAVLNARGELVGTIDAVLHVSDGQLPNADGAVGAYMVPHVAFYTPLTAAAQEWIRATIEANR